MKIIRFLIVKVHFQVNFGCGSGSLLDSLFEHPTTRAAKVYSISLT
jgi:hypothetical protein